MKYSDLFWTTRLPRLKATAREASIELIEMGLAVAKSQQPNQPSMTVQDAVMQSELSETVTALENQVSQLTGVMQDTVLQRLTELETELMGESNA